MMKSFRFVRVSGFFLTIFLFFIFGQPTFLFSQLVDRKELSEQFKYALGLIQRKLHEEAITVLNRIIIDAGTFSKRDEAIFWHAECSYRIKNYGQSISSYERVLRQFPKSEMKNRAAYGLGWAYAKDNNPKSAIEAFSNVDSTDKKLWVDSRLRMCFLMVKFKTDMEVAESIYEDLLSSKELSITQTYETLVQLGSLKFKAQKFADAGDHFTEALKIGKGEEPSIRFYLAESFFRNEQYSQAKTEYENILTSSTTPEILNKSKYSLAWCHIKTGSAKQAEPLFQILAQNPDAENQKDAIRNLIQLKMNLHQYQESADTIKLFINVLPEEDFAEMTYMRGLALSRIGEFPEALSVFDGLKKKYPKHIRGVESRYQLALINIFMAKFREALDELSPLLRRETPPTLREKALYRTAECYINLGNLTNARTSLERLLKEYPEGDTRSDALYQLGEIAYQEGNFSDALIAFTTITKSTGELSSQAAFRSGEVLMRAERYFDAVQTFQEYLSRYPKGTLADDAKYKAGLCYLEMKDLGNALAAFSQLQDSQGYFRLEARFQIGEIAFQLADYPLAIQHFKSILAENPNHPLASRCRRNIGICLYHLKEFSQAAVEFKKIVKDYPSTDVSIPESYFWLGKSLIAQGKSDDGIVEILKVPFMYPKSSFVVEAYVEAARTYMNLDKKEKAADMWKAVLQKQEHGPFTNEAKEALKKFD